MQKSFVKSFGMKLNMNKMENRKKCEKRKSFDNLIYFAIKKDSYNEVHGYLIDLFAEFNVDDSTLEKLDLSMESLEDFYFPIFLEFGTIELFVGTELVHVTFHFKDKNNKKRILSVIREYFEY